MFIIAAQTDVHKCTRDVLNSCLDNIFCCIAWMRFKTDSDDMTTELRSGYDMIITSLRVFAYLCLLGVYYSFLKLPFIILFQQRFINPN